LSKVTERLVKTDKAHFVLDKEINGLDQRHIKFQKKVNDYFSSFLLTISSGFFFKNFK